MQEQFLLSRERQIRHRVSPLPLSPCHARSLWQPASPRASCRAGFLPPKAQLPPLHECPSRTGGLAVAGQMVPLNTAGLGFSLSLPSPQSPLNTPSEDIQELADKTGCDYVSWCFTCVPCLSVLLECGLTAVHIATFFVKRSSFIVS